MSKSTRRTFLMQAAGAAAACAALPRIARADVNSQIRMATIGFNGRGGSHISAFKNQLVALCDCDSRVLGKAAQKFEKDNDRKLDKVTDFRRILDRKDIDAISTATPNHLHALITTLAAQAGKDVYCEKPLSHGVWEGRQVVNAQKKYNRIIQCGTQARSSTAIKDAVEYAQSGKLGKVLCVTGTCYKPRKSIGKLDKPLQIPEFIDYELWCGPAAKVDLFRPKLHYDWHWDYNTGNGDMGNQGIHQMDVARWFHGAKTLSPRVVSVGGRLGYDDAGNAANTQVVFHDYPEFPLIFETRGLPRSKADQANWERSMDNFKGSRIGVVVQCENGYAVSTDSYGQVKVYDNDGKEIESFRGNTNHFDNFLAAVKSRNPADQNADALTGHLSSSLCHTGGISHKLGEKRAAKDIMDSVAGKNEYFRDAVERMLQHLKANEIDVDQPVVTAGAWLEMDPATEQFTNNHAANEMLRRADRAPFIVQEIS